MLTLQWLEQPEPQQPDPAQRWSTLRLSAVPLSRPVLIRLTPAQATMQARQRSLVEGLLRLLARMASVARLPSPRLEPLIEPGPGDQLLEVVLGDGRSPVPSQQRWQ
ncbi:MAG: hypothetical protein ACKOPN_07050, partial [Prochlorococcaceae cyanobacterium]